MSTNNTYFDLANLKASAVAEGTAFLVQDATVDDGAFYWTLGDFTGLADDENIIESDNALLSVGAWVRQGAQSIRLEGVAGIDLQNTQEYLDLLQTAVPDPRLFGVVGDGMTDDTAAWQAWIDWCAANEVPFAPKTPTFVSRITDTLTIPLVLVSITPGLGRALPIDLGNVTFLYDGPRDRVVLDIGDAPGATGYYQESFIMLPQVHAEGTLEWPGTLQGDDTAVRLRMPVRCTIVENMVRGFTKGIEYSGAAYNTITGKHISDCRYGLVCTTLGSNMNHSFFNENVRIGGKIGCTSGAASLGNAFMIVFTWDHVSSYRGHNCNRFIAPCLESNPGGTYQMPIYFDGVGLGNSFEHIRMEGDKGPVAFFDGDSGFACGNSVHLDYCAFSGQEVGIREVNNACGNRLLGTGCHTSEWHSGDLSKIVVSGGAAGVAFIKHRELFTVHGGTPTVSSFKKRDTTQTTAMKSHLEGPCLDSTGYARLCTAVAADQIKQFDFAYSAKAGFIGRPCFLALDANGALLTGNVTETLANPIYAGASAWAASTSYSPIGKHVTNDSGKVYALITAGVSNSTGGPTGTGSSISDGSAAWKYVGRSIYPDELYVKACGVFADSGQFLAASGSNFIPGSENASRSAMRVSVRPEVKTLICGVIGVTKQAVVYAMSIRGHAVGNLPGSTYPTGDGVTALRVFSIPDEDGEQPVTSASPGSSGTFGNYTVGNSVGSLSVASGQPVGYWCSGSGRRAPAWAAGAGYPTPGLLVTNDTGKVYALVTAGTSAGSGGPTGTGSGISDNTCVWRYIGPLATFVAGPNAA